MDNTKSILKKFNSTTLKEMDSVKLMNRTDTKFLFNTVNLGNVLEKAKDKYSVLVINNESILDYRTLYFDTDDFEMYNKHQNGKLNRYKIRHREYLISNDSFLEIKFKSNKERTIKKRIKRKKIEEKFSKKSIEFLKENSPFNPDILKPKLYNHFSRITLVHKHDKERITIDLNLGYDNFKEKKELPFLAITEVKQEGFSNSSDFIKILKSEKIYPTGMSKYCIGTVLLNKQLKYNQFKSKLLTLKKINNDS